AAFAGFGEGQIDAPVVRKRRIERDIEQAALSGRYDIRCAGNLGCLAGGGDEVQRARTLGDEHSAVRKESEAPGMVEAVRDCPDLEGRGLGVRRRRERQSGDY